MWMRLKHTHSFWAQSELWTYQLHPSPSTVRHWLKCSSYHTGLIFNCQQSGMVSTGCFCQHISVLNVHRTRTKLPHRASCSAGSWPCLRLLLRDKSQLSNRRASLSPGELKASIFLEIFWNHRCLISTPSLHPIDLVPDILRIESLILPFLNIFYGSLPLLSPRLIFLRLYIAIILKKIY